MTLTTSVDTVRTLNEFGFARGLGTILKHPADLDRYQRIIELTAPEAVIETGTCSGDSAVWFAELGLQVVTIDVRSRAADWAALACRTRPEAWNRITFLTGNSVDPGIVGEARDLVAGKRCMVSLDSDHTAEHVAAEIAEYGPLVTPGCYLVVEDGIFRYALPAKWARHHFGDPGQGNPLDAIEATLAVDPRFTRDEAIERINPISHHPGGWWIRRDRP